MPIIGVDPAIFVMHTDAAVIVTASVAGSFVGLCLRDMVGWASDALFRKAEPDNVPEHKPGGDS